MQLLPGRDTMQNLDPERLIENGTDCPPGSLETTRLEAGSLPFAHLNFPPDPRLVAEGWERRFMTDPERAKEAVELYTGIGFEVRLEPVNPSELSAWCAGCQVVVCRSFTTLYTRKK